MEGRFKSNEFGLTYSQCPVESLAVLDLLRMRLGDKVTYCSAVREHHKDGSFHIHAHVQFGKVFNAVDSSFDLLFNGQKYHPNIQKIRDSSAWMNYLLKEGTVDAWGLFTVLNQVKLKKKKLTNKELLDGDLIEMVDDEKISLSSLPSLLYAKNLYLSMKHKRDKKKLDEIMPPFWKDIEIKLADKKTKCRHFWIFSEMPNKGKTTFLELLREKYECSSYSCAEKYQDIDSVSDLILFDEIGKGNCPTITVLNQICDGTYKYPVKGGHSVLLDKPYAFVCSNFGITDVYPNSNGRVEARFNEINLNYSEFI